MTDQAQDFWSAFSSLAARVPDVEAILAPGRSSLRFGELPSRLEATRDALNRFGIGRGDRVVVILPRGPEMAVCYLGVASSATFAALNPDAPESELRQCLEQLRPSAVVVAKGHVGAGRAAAATLGLKVIDLSPIETGPAGTFVLECDRPAVPAPSAWATAEDVALVLLTSGTTAKQKLVPLRHRHVLANARAMKEKYSVGPADRCLHLMPMFHGHGLLTLLFLSLNAGSGVVCPTVVDTESIFALIEQFRPTWLSAGYTIHRAILEGVDRHPDVVRRANFRFMKSGSGRLDIKVLTGLEQAFRAPVLEGYSMSETGILTSNPLPPRVRKPGTVGVPLTNDVRVMDESGAFLGPGQVGEVVARGPGVFDGYLDAPEATAAAFVDGWFRTGDLGCFDANGYLTITGRVKDVINRGGEKFGPLEVERALAEHPAVAEVCVFGVPHPTLGEEVAAAAIPATSPPPSEQAMLAFARDRLAAFKVPRRIVFVTAFPRGATGKVDRRALADLCMSTTGAVPERAAAPRFPSPLETDIAALWQAILRRTDLAVDDDFFLSGGDSLKAAQVFARVRERFGVALPLQHIFGEAATVAGMARLIERERDQAHSGELLPEDVVPIRTGGDRPPLFGIPGRDGTPIDFAHLGWLLDPEQPLYGLSSRGLDGKQAPLESMEAIAADNITKIRALQRHGPYYLTGVCFGARVAYEMARQLDAAGDEVGLLIMLDPSPPFTGGNGRPRGVPSAWTRLRERTRLPRFVLNRMVMYARELRRLGRTERVAYLRSRLKLLRGIVGQRDLFRGDRSEWHHAAVYEANCAAGQRYLPGPYHGPTVVCFTTDRAVLGPRDRRLDWGNVVRSSGGLHYVPGRNSAEMLSPPHVAALAERINTWLAQAHAASPDRQAAGATVAGAAD